MAEFRIHHPQSCRARVRSDGAEVETKPPEHSLPEELAKRACSAGPRWVRTFGQAGRITRAPQRCHGLSLRLRRDCSR